jgi:translation initiation factor IF-2
LRNEEKIGKGRIVGLQKQKRDVDEVGKGSECGLLYEGNAKTEEGDVLAAFTEERQKGEL